MGMPMPGWLWESAGPPVRFEITPKVLLLSITMYLGRVPSPPQH